MSEHRFNITWGPLDPILIGDICPPWGTNNPWVMGPYSHWEVGVLDFQFSG